MPQPYALTTGSPRHWHTSLCCGQSRGAARSMEIARGAPELSFAACASSGWRQVVSHWPSCSDVDMSRPQWPGTASVWSKSMSPQWNGVQRGAAWGSRDSAVTPVGHSQGLADPGLEKPGCYLQVAAYELPSLGSWQLQPDLSRLHLDLTWLLASSNESLNTMLPTRPALGLAWAEETPIYLQQPVQSVP